MNRIIYEASPKVCSFCGNILPFKKRSNKFCNQSCSAKLNNIGNNYRTKNMPIASCRCCDEELANRRTKYCDNCKPRRDKIDNATLTDYTSNSYDSSKYNKVRFLARQTWKESGLPQLCLNCGYDKHYEVCHIRAIASFAGDSLIKEINNINNLVALCRNCHWELDNELLNIEDIFPSKV